MKPVRPTTADGKARLVEWLQDNDTEFLQVLKDTALIFSPLEVIGYRNNDDDKHKKLVSWMNDQREILTK